MLSFLIMYRTLLTMLWLFIFMHQYLSGYLIVFQFFFFYVDSGNFFFYARVEL